MSVSISSMLESLEASTPGLVAMAREANANARAFMDADETARQQLAARTRDHLHAGRVLVHTALQLLLETSRAVALTKGARVQPVITVAANALRNVPSGDAKALTIAAAALRARGDALNRLCRLEAPGLALRVDIQCRAMLAPSLAPLSAPAVSPWQTKTPRRTTPAPPGRGRRRR